MRRTPKPILDFLSGKCIAVAGVSRSNNAPANAIYKRFLETGHDVIPINPNASHLEGVPSYPNLTTVPRTIHSLMLVTHPSTTLSLVYEASSLDIQHIWFHRSLGQGSVSPEAIEFCRQHGINYIEGGCPLMYCQPVDPFHRCLGWLLHVLHRIPRA